MRLPRDFKEVRIALRLGWYMHWFAAIFGIVGLCMAAASARSGNVPGAVGALVFLGLVVVIEWVLVWQGLYLQKYLPAVRRFQREGWDEGLVEFRSHSLCERRMIQMAADETGLGEPCRIYLSTRKVQDWKVWAPQAKESVRKYRAERQRARQAKDKDPR